jgi:hypothetical protein
VADVLRPWSAVRLAELGESADGEHAQPVALRRPAGIVDRRWRNPQAIPDFGGFVPMTLDGRLDASGDAPRTSPPKLRLTHPAARRHPVLPLLGVGCRRRRRS